MLAFILLKSDRMSDPGVRLLPGANCTHFFNIFNGRCVGEGEEEEDENIA